MLLELDDIRIPISFSPFILIDRFCKGISHAFGGIDPTLSSVSRSKPSNIELADKGLFLCEEDREVVKSKHKRPKVLFVERPADLAGAHGNRKQKFLFCSPLLGRAISSVSDLIYRCSSERLTLGRTAIFATQCGYTDCAVIKNNSAHFYNYPHSDDLLSTELATELAEPIALIGGG